MREHRLKCWVHYFDAIERGEKTFEVRRNDRDFVKGDVLILERFSPELGYLDKSVRRTVTYILHGGQFGIEPGYVVMALAEPAVKEPERP